MGKSFFSRFFMVPGLIAVLGWMGGCERDVRIGGSASAEKTLETPDADTDSSGAQLAVDEKNALDAFPDGLPKFLKLAEECCETTGHANECWQQDALKDDETGYILCNSDADCEGRPCNKGANVTAALAKYPGISATGLCQCNSHADCRDTDDNGGSCFTYGDDGSGQAVNLCGPSMCNGYYVCSCWGGCTWWDGNDFDNTPDDDASSLGLYCCENGEYANPDLESGLVTFGNQTCSGSFMTLVECTTAADCDAPSVNNSAWSDQCVDVSCNATTGRCEYALRETGDECDLDTDICTVDLCSASGACAYSEPRVTPDSFGAASELNTCTEDCIPAGDNLSYTSYDPLTLPQDVATRPTTNACYSWTCTTSAGVTFPEEEAVVCVDTDTSDCTIPQCDPAGTNGNCDDSIPVTCSGTPSVCNTIACVDAAGGCTEVFDATQDGDTDPCTGLNNALFDSRRPNCYSGCVSQTHGTAPTELEGVCSSLYAINDSCATAIDMGAFTSTNGVESLDIRGSTVCATNQHESATASCLEAVTGTPMGHASADVVYSFQYEPIDDGVTDLYVIKVESADSSYDETVYVSIGAASCVAGAIASEPCDVYDPPHGTYPDRSHNDHCFSSKLRPPSTDACEAVDTTGVYTNGMGRAIIEEDTSDFSAGPITVYVYVDGNTEFASYSDPGDFYLSVTKEIPGGCPPLSSWFGGTVNTPTGLPLGVPINGTDFSAMTPNTLLGADGRVAQGVLLAGDTTNDSNSYTGEASDDGFAWQSYEEAWRLDVQAATQFTTSLCDFESTVTDSTFDTMVGLFNCHGERVIFNDDGAGDPFYPEGDILCTNGKSHIRQTPTLDMDNAPYYLIVDGYYQSGIRGELDGSPYELAVYYNPFGDIDCDPSTAGGHGLIRSGSTGPYPDRANLDIGQSECALLVNSDGGDDIPGRAISFHWDGGIQPGEWQCATGVFSYCTPITLIMTLIYKNGADDTCTETLVDWSNGFHGNYAPIYIPTELTNIDGVTCDQFLGIAVTYEYPPGLSAGERTSCESACALVKLKFDA